MNPDNARILRITAAAGTELADAYSYVKLMSREPIRLRRIFIPRKMPPRGTMEH